MKINFKKIVVGMLGIAFLIVNIMPSYASTTEFKDVDSRNPYYTAIMALKEDSVLKGYPDGFFRSDNKVLRVEAVTMFDRAFNVSEPEGYYYPPHPDLIPESYYWHAVVKSYTYGIATGYPETGLWGPDLNVILSEALAMGYRTIAIDNKSILEVTSTKTPVFNDTDVNAWHYVFFQLADTDKVVFPNELGLIYPDQVLSRGQMAYIIYRMREAMKAKGVVLKDYVEPKTTPVLDFIPGTPDIPDFSLSNGQIAAGGTSGTTGSTVSEATGSTVNGTTGTTGSTASGTTDSETTDSGTSGSITFNRSTKIGNCPVFPDQHYFNQDISDTTKYPVLSNSDTIMKNIGLYGFNPSVTTLMPMIRTMTENQPLIELKCDPNISWCPNGLVKNGISWSAPPDLEIAPGHDHHSMFILETANDPTGGFAAPSPLTPADGGKNCFLYESWWSGRILDNATPPAQPVTSYTPGSNVTGFTTGGLSVFDMKRNITYAVPGVGGSSASGFPLLAGIIRYDEAKSGQINHASAIALPFPRYATVDNSGATTSQLSLNCKNSIGSNQPTNQTQKALQNFANVQSYPCDLWNVNLPAIGQRFRLKSTFDLSQISCQEGKNIATSWMKNGFIVTDGSGGGFVVPLDNDPRWQAIAWPCLQDLHKMTLTDLEAVYSGTITDLPVLGLQNHQPNTGVFD